MCYQGNTATQPSDAETYHPDARWSVLAPYHPKTPASTCVQVSGPKSRPPADLSKLQNGARLHTVSAQTAHGHSTRTEWLAEVALGSNRSSRFLKHSLLRPGVEELLTDNLQTRGAASGSCHFAHACSLLRGAPCISHS